MKPTKLVALLLISLVMSFSLGWMDFQSVTDLVELQNLPALLLLAGLIFLLLTATLSFVEFALVEGRSDGSG